MGIFESTTNTQSKEEIPQGIIPNMQQKHTKNHPVNMLIRNLKINECRVTSRPFSNFDQDTKKRLSKEICRIVIETKEGQMDGTGFFLSFPIEMEWFDCLLTNDHIINNESINNNQIIYITFEGYKHANI